MPTRRLQAVVVGGGTPQSISFSGTASGLFGTTVGSCSISANGNGTESLLTGSGAGSLNCVGAGISESCSFSYVRVGAPVVITGSCGGTASGTLVAVGLFVPSSAPLITSFSMAGEFQILI